MPLNLDSFNNNSASQSHRGEWRDLFSGIREYCCVIPGTSSQNDGLVCTHSLLRAKKLSHWSCCGSLDESSSNCSKTTPISKSSQGKAVADNSNKSNNKHEFSTSLNGNSTVCTRCGRCSSFGELCVVRSAESEGFRASPIMVGRPCGCGPGESGCSVCGVCRACSLSVPCRPPSVNIDIDSDDLVPLRRAAGGSSSLSEALLRNATSATATATVSSGASNELSVGSRVIVPAAAVDRSELMRAMFRSGPGSHRLGAGGILEGTVLRLTANNSLADVRLDSLNYVEERIPIRNLSLVTTSQSNNSNNNNTSNTSSPRHSLTRSIFDSMASGIRDAYEPPSQQQPIQPSRERGPSGPMRSQSRPYQDFGYFRDNRDRDRDRDREREQEIEREIAQERFNNPFEGSSKGNRSSTSKHSAPGVHSGMLHCKCSHNLGRIPYPLDESYFHLSGCCKWECCGQPFNSPNPCPAAAAASIASSSTASAATTAIATAATASDSDSSATAISAARALLVAELTGKQSGDRRSSSYESIAPTAATASRSTTIPFAIAAHSGYIGKSLPSQYDLLQTTAFGLGGSNNGISVGDGSDSASNNNTNNGRGSKASSYSNKSNNNSNSSSSNSNNSNNNASNAFGSYSFFDFNNADYRIINCPELLEVLATVPLSNNVEYYDSLTGKVKFAAVGLQERVEADSLSI